MRPARQKHRRPASESTIYPQGRRQHVQYSFFGTGVNSSFQGNNYSQDLKDRGLTTPNSLKKAYDVNGPVGGPIKKDKLWFFVSCPPAS